MIALLTALGNLVLARYSSLVVFGIYCVSEGFIRMSMRNSMDWPIRASARATVAIILLRWALVVETLFAVTSQIVATSVTAERIWLFGLFALVLPVLAMGLAYQRYRRLFESML